MSQSTHEGSISTRAWAWLVLGLSTTAVGAVAAFNLVVDPTAQLGTGVLEPIAAGPRDRTAKVELLDRLLRDGDPNTPDTVVLGSSRSKKLDPAWLGRPDGFNAAVVGGDLFEARVFAAWLADRIRHDDTRETAGPGSARYPQLVVGVDIEQFRDSSLHGSGFLAVPQVERVARLEAGGGNAASQADEVARVGHLLVSAQILRASIASLRQRIAAGTPHDDIGGEPVAIGDFTARGVPRSDRAYEQDGPRRQRLLADTPRNIQDNVEEYRTTYRNNGARLDDEAVDDLRALVRIARESGGPPPLLYVTPGHPALDVLDALGRSDRHEAVLALLDDVAANGRAIVVDCSHCIDDDTINWLDATHPSPIGMHQLADELAPRLEARTTTGD